MVDMNKNSSVRSQFTTVDQAARYGAQLLQDEMICLRETEAADLDRLAEWWNDPQWAVFQQRVIKPRPAAEVITMMEGWSQNKPFAGDTGFSIFERSSGDLIGHAVLFGATLPQRSAEIALMLTGDRVGQGLGTRATKLMLRYGFEEMGLHRIGLKVAAFNARAIRAYEKAGFIHEGRERDVYFHAGAFHDQILMSVLETDYFAR